MSSIRWLDDEKRRRLTRVGSVVGILLSLGGIYAAWLFCGGTPIPCLFHLFTGLKCPGCGVTAMCMALLRLDFSAAWRANPCLLCLLPIGAVVGVRMLWRFIRTGTKQPEKWVSVLIVLMIAALLIFSLLRNLL